MRATSNGRHISGAERIVPFDAVERTVQELITRAYAKTEKPATIVIHIDDLGNANLHRLQALDLVTVNTSDASAGRAAASRVLQATGVSEQAAKTAICLLSQGPAKSGGNMRGAILMDSQTGDRLEPDQERGVRASRFDWSEETLVALEKRLGEMGLTHFRTREALALATKVAHAPGVIAELCWSDESDYTAGYVASQKTGYVRFPILKQLNDPHGGRVFFVNNDNLDMDALIHYLQNEPILITSVGECRIAIKPEEYFTSDPRFPLRPLR